MRLRCCRLHQRDVHLGHLTHTALNSLAHILIIPAHAHSTDNHHVMQLSCIASSDVLATVGLLFYS